NLSRSGTMGNRKLGTIIMSFFLLITLLGCESEKVVYINPTLPTFSPQRPVRPHLIQTDDGLQLPISVLENLVLLQGYSKELEVYASGWEEFYEKLREEYKREDIQDK
ncbi:MAG: hypothetical protein ACI4NM_00940, partial [Bullifex sp.]